MSAVAFAITKPKIVLLSDGMTIKNGEIYETDHSKIHKINDRVALLWIGIGAHPLAGPIKQLIQAKGLTEPEEIAIQAGQALKAGFRGSGNEHLLGGSDTGRFWVTTIGYDKEGNPVVYQLDSQEDYRYEPKQAPIQPGMIGSMVNGFDYNQAPFSKLLATKYLPLYKDLNYAAKQAFKETIERCKENHVGGDMFFETLSPVSLLADSGKTKLS